VTRWLTDGDRERYASPDPEIRHKIGKLLDESP